MVDNLWERPLTRQEERFRQLYDCAHDVVERLELVKNSLSSLERIEIMVNGVGRSPGLIECVELLTVAIRQLELTLSRQNNETGVYNRADANDTIKRLQDMDERLRSTAEKLDRLLSDRKQGFYLNMLGFGFLVVLFISAVGGLQLAGLLQ
jgi:hypothetical protein